MAQPASTVAALNLSTPFSVAGSSAAVYSFHQRMIETCWPKVATMQNRPAAANRIEKTPNASVSSTRAASMISVKFATMIEHLMMNTLAMPRMDGFLREPRQLSRQSGASGSRGCSHRTFGTYFLRKFFTGLAR